MVLASKLLPREFRRSLFRRYYALKGLLGGDTSQFGETRALAKYITADFPKFVVDVGAYDGITFSNSYPHIRQGWRAILVEPHPSVFRILAQTHSGNKHVTCINKACSDHAGSLPLFVSTDGDIGQTSTLCTDDNELFNTRKSTKTIDVEVETLTNILAEGGAPRDIGLLFIDAEGMDYEVLCGLDFNRYAPRLIVTEDYPLNAEKHAAKYQLLQSHGYSLEMMIGCNSVWLRSSVDINR
jgi:FkbM family methyltransferase